MANVINQLQCATTLKNTGVCDCPFDPELIVGKILIPKTRVLTEAELNDIQATLEDLVQAAIADRIFPVQNLVAITDGSEEPTFQTFGYGSTVPVREGKYNWIFQFKVGGVQLSNALRSFNGNSRYAELYIIQGQGKQILMGTLKKDANGNDGLAGVPQDGGYPYTYPWKANDGTNVASYRTQSVFQPVYVNENIAYFEVPATTYLLSELEGLQQVHLTVVETDDTNDTVTIKARTVCGEDLYDDFADELEEVTAWVGDQDGEVIVHTVAKNDSLKAWDITYTSLDLTAGDVWSLASPEILAAAPINVSGYASDEVLVPVGS